MKTIIKVQLSIESEKQSYRLFFDGNAYHIQSFDESIKKWSSFGTSIHDKSVAIKLFQLGIADEIKCMIEVI